MITSIFAFEVINFVLSDPKVFFWMAVSLAAAVNPNGIKTL